VKIIHTNRKTISIGLDKKGNVIIKIPNNLKQSELDEILKLYKPFVEKLSKKSNLIKDNLKHFKEGEEFFYLGKKYKLKIIKEQKEDLIFKNGFLLSENKIDKSKEIFKNWYCEQTYNLVMNKVNYFSKKFNLKFSHIKISSSKISWGSCNSKKEVRFSWRLSMLPEDIIEYVVVHELAHLKELNHSRKFWNLVELMLPSYKIHRKWLRENNYLFINLF